jgi:hypothetical protein
MKAEFYKIVKGRATVYVMREGKQVTVLYGQGIRHEFAEKCAKAAEKWFDERLRNQPA